MGRTCSAVIVECWIKIFFANEALLRLERLGSSCQTISNKEIFSVSKVGLKKDKDLIGVVIFLTFDDPRNV